jgi:hypothetical protein
MGRKERVERKIGFEDAKGEAEEFAHSSTNNAHGVFGFGSETSSEVTDKRVVGESSESRHVD